MVDVIQRDEGAIEPMSRAQAGIRPILRATREFVARWSRALECPLCRARPKRFLPFGLNIPVLKELDVIGGGYRDNAQCPACGCIDRERLLYLYLVHQTDLCERPIRLLHVAPEARVSELLHSRPNIDYLTADISGQQVMAEMDITDIRFPAGSFDAIICNHVLEHIVDDARAMSELHRVLKPGGWSILQVPFAPKLRRTIEDPSITSPPEREKAFGQSDHVRIYGQDYPARLVRAGFEVEAFRWTSRRELFGGWLNRCGLNPAERVFIARKRP